MSHPANEIFPQAALMPTAGLAGSSSSSPADAPTSWSVASDSVDARALTSPFFVSGNHSTATADWPSISGALKKHSVLVHATTQELQAVAPADLPPRLATVTADQGIDFDEATTADFLQILCEDRRGVPAWPIGCSPAGLPNFVTSLRFGAGGDCPVGLVLSTSTHANDLKTALECGIDFLVLRSTTDELTYQDLASLSRLANLNNQRPAPIALLADFPCVSAKEFFIVASLGAAAMSIDRVIEPAIESKESTQGQTEGLLSSLGIAGLETRADQPRKSSSLIDQAITELKAEITRLIFQTGASKSSELDAAMLRTTSEFASKALGIPSL